MGYFLGGSSYAFMVYGIKTSDLDCLITLKYATKRVLRTAARRLGFGHRKTLAQTLLRMTEARLTFQRNTTIMRQSSPTASFRPSVVGYDEESPHPASKNANMSSAMYSSRSLLPLYHDVRNTVLIEEEDPSVIGYAEELHHLASTSMSKKSTKSSPTLSFHPSVTGYAEELHHLASTRMSVKSNNRGFLTGYNHVINTVLAEEKDNIEEYLSCAVSCTSENKSQFLMDSGKLTFLSKLEWTSTSCPLGGSLFMYRITLTTASDDQTGFILESL